MAINRVVLMGGLDRQAAQVCQKLGRTDLAVVATKSRRVSFRNTDLLLLVQNFGSHSQLAYVRSQGGNVVFSRGGVTSWVTTIKTVLGI